MQLQIALDRVSLSDAVELTKQVRESADWIEVGTSLIKRYGVAAVEQIVAAAGRTPVLADSKTADDARNELLMFYAAGATSATVLGCVELATIQRALETAAEQSAEIVIDLLATDDHRKDEISRMIAGRRHVVMAAHVGKDSQGPKPARRIRLGSWPVDVQVAIAGGLSSEDVPWIRSARPDARLIVGSAITAAADPGAAAAETHEAVRQPRHGANKQ
jgi:3-hexulose-6-phosphate synthase